MDYDALWKRELRPTMKASITNRLLFELIRNGGYRFQARRMSRAGDIRRAWIGGYYRPVRGQVASFSSCGAGGTVPNPF